MALVAQRFAGQATLEACVASGHRMLAGEGDSVAVRRLQDALVDLGYLDRLDVNGVFDERTGHAVSAFKIDEGLAPTDPVASVGTVGRLDALFAHEVADPMAPDPSVDGLGASALIERDTAHGWAFAAETLLAQGREAPPPDAPPQALHVEASVERHFKVSEHGESRGEFFDTVLVPMAHKVQEVLMLLELEGVPDLTATDVRLALAWNPALRVQVSPGFRNALDPTARAFHLLRVAALACHLNAHSFGWPGTARYASLDARWLTRNSVSYAALFHDVATGGTVDFRAQPLWYL